MISSIQPSAVGATPVRAINAPQRVRPDSLAVLLAKETIQSSASNSLLDIPSTLAQEEFVRRHSIPVSSAVGVYAAGNTRVNLNIMPWELVRLATVPEAAPPLYV